MSYLERDDHHTSAMLQLHYVHKLLLHLHDSSNYLHRGFRVEQITPHQVSLPLLRHALSMFMGLGLPLDHPFPHPLLPHMLHIH